MARAPRARREPWFVDEIRAPDEPHHALRDALRGRRQRDPFAVRAPVDAARRIVRRAVAGARRHDSRLVVARDLRAERGEHRLDDREIDDLAAPRALARLERRERRERGVQPRDRVGERKRRQQRRAARLARDGREPAHRLGERAEARPARIRAELPEARHAHQHEARVERRQHVVAEPPALQRAGTEVLDDDVRRRRELAKQPLTVRVPEVERHRALVARDHLPPERHVVAPRAVLAGGVARRMLDLDHVGAVIGEHRRRERAGEQRRRVDHANAVERRRGARVRSPLRPRLVEVHVHVHVRHRVLQSTRRPERLARSGRTSSGYLTVARAHCPGGRRVSDGVDLIQREICLDLPGDVIGRERRHVVEAVDLGRLRPDPVGRFLEVANRLAVVVAPRVRVNVQPAIDALGRAQVPEPHAGLPADRRDDSGAADHAHRRAIERAAQIVEEDRHAAPAAQLADDLGERALRRAVVRLIVRIAAVARLVVCEMREAAPVDGRDAELLDVGEALVAACRHRDAKALALGQLQLGERRAAAPAEHQIVGRIDVRQLRAPAFRRDLPVVPRGEVAAVGRPLQQRMAAALRHRHEIVRADLRAARHHADRPRCIVRIDELGEAVLIALAERHHHADLADLRPLRAAPAIDDAHERAVAEHDLLFAALATDVDRIARQRMIEIRLPRAVQRLDQRFVILKIGELERLPAQLAGHRFVLLRLFGASIQHPCFSRDHH
ncbi:hypothetical protein BURPS1710b_A1263 [Burkholderia pseudomallei 1710b]|uniref:Uncharacterized protein n=1 Tax=Burkholderia pseudomallei (strain 1710b) TaxID=320372 RepID=Q3JJ33_BURP1|nr:hypothetical protein BURPS1710b_A1263 [Burkholderia pseudomallei 1710b]